MFGLVCSTTRQNQTENVRNYLMQQLRKNKITNLEEIWIKINEKWNALPPEFYHKSIQEILKILQTVQLQKGYFTKY